MSTTERVLPRDDTRADTASESAPAHMYCRECYGVPVWSRATFPVTSMCGLVTRVPRPRRTGPYCRVCMDYSDRNRCPAGHQLRG